MISRYPFEDPKKHPPGPLKHTHKKIPPNKKVRKKKTEFCSKKPAPEPRPLPFSAIKSRRRPSTQRWMNCMELIAPRKKTVGTWDESMAPMVMNGPWEKDGELMSMGISGS